MAVCKRRHLQILFLKRFQGFLSNSNPMDSIQSVKLCKRTLHSMNQKYHKTSCDSSWPDVRAVSQHKKVMFVDLLNVTLH